MKKILLKNVNIYDGKLESDLLLNHDILIEDGKIIKDEKNFAR